MGSPAPAGRACPEGYLTVLSPFSMDDGQPRDLGHQLVDRLGEYLDKFPRAPVYRPLSATVRQELEEMAIPATGAAPEDVIDSFARLVLREDVRCAS